MSALLDEIIAARKAKAIDYEGYLKRIAEWRRGLKQVKLKIRPSGSIPADCWPLPQSRSQPGVAIKIDET